MRRAGIGAGAAVAGMSGAARAYTVGQGQGAGVFFGDPTYPYSGVWWYDPKNNESIVVFLKDPYGQALLSGVEIFLPEEARSFQQVPTDADQAFEGGEVFVQVYRGFPSQGILDAEGWVSGMIVTKDTKMLSFSVNGKLPSSISPTGFVNVNAFYKIVFDNNQNVKLLNANVTVR